MGKGMKNGWGIEEMYGFLITIPDEHKVLYDHKDPIRNGLRASHFVTQLRCAVLPTAVCWMTLPNIAPYHPGSPSRTLPTIAPSSSPSPCTDDAAGMARKSLALAAGTLAAAGLAAGTLAAAGLAAGTLAAAGLAAGTLAAAGLAAGTLAAAGLAAGTLAAAGLAAGTLAAAGLDCGTLSATMGGCDADAGWGLDWEDATYLPDTPRGGSSGSRVSLLCPVLCSLQSRNSYEDTGTTIVLPTSSRPSSVCADWTTSAIQWTCASADGSGTHGFTGNDRMVLGSLSAAACHSACEALGSAGCCESRAFGSGAIRGCLFKTGGNRYSSQPHGDTKAAPSMTSAIASNCVVGDTEGHWGGYCACPDGNQYAVSDNYDNCGTLACTGCTQVGACNQDHGTWSYKSVVCTAAASTTSPCET
eukprot:gene3183-biopygen106242